MFSPSAIPSIVAMASYSSFHFFDKLPANVKRMIFVQAFEDSNWDAVELAWVSREVRTW